jgi:DNA replication factor GINS
MNLGDLQSARSKERQKDSLQHLREDFYADVGRFVEELRTERERAAAAADDPFAAPEVRRLTDDIETAENTVEAIYERRVGKLVKLASLDAAGMPADEDGLTSEERDLFDTLVDSIESNRAHVLEDVLAGEGDATATDDAAETSSAPGVGESATPTDAGPAAETVSDDATAHDTAEPAGTAEPDGGVADAEGTAGRAESGAAEGGVTAADAMGGDTPSAAADESLSDEARGDEPSASERSSEAGRASAGADDAGSETAQRESDDTDRTTVRITRDVGEIMGVDERTYHLASEDVVTLPEVNATPLLERDAAEQLE